jgi:hypothetical protein
VGSNVIISSVLKRKRLTSTDVDPYLLVIDINTGQKVFEKLVEDNTYSLYFMNSFVDPASGNIALLGQYYKKDDNVVKGKSLGLCSYILDPQGNVITKNYASWLNDVRKFLPVNALGKIEHMGYLFFHKMLRTANGKYYAVGEQYKKAASAAGIAMNVLLGAGSAGLTKMVIEDMVLLEFSNQFKLENVQIFDKTKTVVELGGGMDLAGPQITALYLKALGYFTILLRKPMLKIPLSPLDTSIMRRRKGRKTDWFSGQSLTPTRNFLPIN